MTQVTRLQQWGMRARTKLGRALFGDRIGLVLFLGSLCFVTLYWRDGVFITDNITLVEGLTALNDGHVWIEAATGDALSTPGTNVRDGFVYGRNYGQLVLSLPALWGLQVLAAIADLHVALLAAWHLLALAFVVTLGRVLDRRRLAALGGSALVLGSFLLNLGLVTAFATRSLPLLALQATSAVAAGFVAVFLYRLLARIQTRRAGIVAGAGAVVAMPIGFWATVPKRHVFSALVCVAILYAFVRSRTDGSVTVPRLGTVPAFRAAAYALVGILTWIHAAEGLFVCLALVAADVPTAPSNDLRTLAIVGGVFGIALLPTAVTNLLVTGAVVEPPRTLGGGGLAGATQGGTTGGAEPVSGGTGGIGVIAPLVEVIYTIPLVAPLAWLYARVTGLLGAGFEQLAHAEPVYRTFVRSSIEGISQDTRFLGVNLALLEAAPVLGTVAGTALWTFWTRQRALRQRIDAADLLAVFLTLVFVALYIERLPLNTQITVRYLLVLYPLAAYLLVRAQPVRRLVEQHLATIVWTYTAGVLIGGQLLLTSVVLGQYATAEAARLHALLGVILGGIVALLSLGSVLDRRLERPAAVGLGLAATAGTVFLLLSGLHYFSFTGEYVLPVADAISDLIDAAA